MHGEGICLVLETRQAPPKKPGAEKAKTKGVPQLLFFASAILDWSLILGRGGGGGGGVGDGCQLGLCPVTAPCHDLLFKIFLCICTFL